MNKPTQEQMYYRAAQRDAAINTVFLEMIKGDAPLTKSELRALIEKRPELWGRFSAWLDSEVLPE